MDWQTKTQTWFLWDNQWLGDNQQTGGNPQISQWDQNIQTQDQPLNEGEVSLDLWAQPDSADVSHSEEAEIDLSMDLPVFSDAEVKEENTDWTQENASSNTESLSFDEVPSANEWATEETISHVQVNPLQEPTAGVIQMTSEPSQQVASQPASPVSEASIQPQMQQSVQQVVPQFSQQVPPQMVAQQPVQFVQQVIPQVQPQPVVSAPVQDIHNDNPAANTQIPSETDIVAPLPGFFWGLFGGAKNLFSKWVSMVSDVAWKTVQTGMGVIGWATKTVVGAGSSLASWVTWAVVNNQGGNFFENAVWMVKDVASATVQTGTQAVWWAVDLWKTTVSGAVDMGKNVAWTAVNIVPWEFWGNIIQWAVDAVGNVADKTVNIAGSVTDTAVNMGTSAVNTVSNVENSTVGSAWNTSSVVENWVSNGEWFGSIAGNIWSSVIWTVTNAAGTVTNFGSSAINTITDSVQWAWNNELPEWTIQWPTSIPMAV